MELKLIRKYFTENSTVGELYVNDKLYCYVLEDVDRGLDSKMGIKRIAWLKQHSKTAIPYGKYEIANTYSNRFKKYLPLLINVPGYDGIRIHPGNYADDTEGCLLPGTYDPKVPNFVGNSRVTFDALFKVLQDAEKKEKIFIEITWDQTSQQNG